MTKPSIQDLAEFIQAIVIPFYNLERQTPLPPSGAGRHEDDAQHSWSTALLATALAPLVDETLDTGKVCQFAIIHDLVEVVSGDVSNFASAADKAGKDEREAAAQQVLRQKLQALPWIPATIHEYETQATPEARFVKSMDKVILLLFDYVQEGEFPKTHNVTTEVWKEGLQKHREKAQAHAGAFEYYDQLWNLMLAHPEFFYQPKD